jgi:hypothetical protein
VFVVRIKQELEGGKLCVCGGESVVQRWAVLEEAGGPAPWGVKVLRLTAHTWPGLAVVLLAGAGRAKQEFSCRALTSQYTPDPASGLQSVGALLSLSPGAPFHRLRFKPIWLTTFLHQEVSSFPLTLPPQMGENKELPEVR